MISTPFGEKHIIPTHIHIHGFTRISLSVSIQSRSSILRISVPFCLGQSLLQFSTCVTSFLFISEIWVFISSSFLWFESVIWLFLLREPITFAISVVRPNVVYERCCTFSSGV